MGKSSRGSRSYVESYVDSDSDADNELRGRFITRNLQGHSRPSTGFENSLHRSGRRQLEKPGTSEKPGTFGNIEGRVSSSQQDVKVPGIISTGDPLGNESSVGFDEQRNKKGKLAQH